MMGDEGEGVRVRVKVRVRIMKRKAGEMKVIKKNIEEGTRAQKGGRGDIRMNMAREDEDLMKIEELRTKRKREKERKQQHGKRQKQKFSDRCFTLKALTSGCQTWASGTCVNVKPSRFCFFFKLKKKRKKKV